MFQASRAQILKQATEYIQYMTKKNSTHQHDIEDLKRQNSVLEQQGKYINFILRAIPFKSMQRGGVEEILNPPPPGIEFLQDSPPPGIKFCHHM